MTNPTETLKIVSRMLETLSAMNAADGYLALEEDGAPYLLIKQAATAALANIWGSYAARYVMEDYSYNEDPSVSAIRESLRNAHHILERRPRDYRVGSLDWYDCTLDAAVEYWDRESSDMGERLPFYAATYPVPNAPRKWASITREFVRCVSAMDRGEY